MNNSIFFFIGVLFVLTSSKTFAEDLEPVLLFSLSNKKVVRIGVVNNSSKNVSLTIKDSKSEVVFKRNIKAGEEYFEFQNLSKLPLGEYSISVIGGKFKSKKIFYVSKSNIEIAQNFKTHFVKEKLNFQNILTGKLEFLSFSHTAINCFYNNKYVISSILNNYKYNWS